MAPLQQLVYPQRLVVGEGAAASLGAELGAGDGAPLLVVCDAALVGSDGLTAALASLAEAGYDVEVFDRVRAEPTVALAEEVRGRARTRRHARVVGIGGGSAMDLAKVAAALCADPDVTLPALATGRPLAACAPLALVPTTAGTGAEATVIAMLFGDAGKVILKTPSFVPQLAVLDPALVRTLPPGPTAATGVDALAHALEAYLSTAASPFSDAAAVQAATLVAGALERAVRDGDDMGARRDTLVGAHLAGQALNAGVVLGHSMAYVLAEQGHLSHGVSVAIALPWCLLYSMPRTAPRLDAIAPAVTGAADADASDLVRFVWDLSRRLGLPARPADAGVEAGRAAANATRTITAYPRPTSPVPLEHERLTRLWALMDEGDLDAALAAWDG